jgi:Fe-S cluster assembly protein SufD
MMDAKVIQSEAEKTLAQQFAQAKSRLPGGAEVARLRGTAFARFEAAGLPTRRVEEWKYTNLRTLMPNAAPLAPAPDANALKRAAEIASGHTLRNVRRLVLVDGSFVPSLSDLGNLDKGLTIRSLASALGEADVVSALSQPSDDPLVLLNAALMTDGIVIDLDADATPARPIHVVHISTGAEPASIFTRSLVRVGARAKVTLVETFAGHQTAYQVHDALVLSMGEGADFDYVRLMEDEDDAVNISTMFAALGSKTNFNIFNLTSGGAVSRYQAFIRCDGEGAIISTNGVNLLKGEQHGDTTLFVDHAVAHCMSREVMRAVLDDTARSVFQGRILVRPDAQKTDAKMMSRALLLSDGAEVDNKPELEIFADDVTCGHGATAGALDDNLLFYLKARGLPEKEAQALLIQAFVGEAIESIVDDGLREAAIGAAVRWVEARG